MNGLSIWVDREIWDVVGALTPPVIVIASLHCLFLYVL